MENADVFLGLQEFLERMRHPSAADFVKSIKTFIVSFSNNPPDPDRDSASVQDFLARMESDFRSHPLWSGCSPDDLDGAGEGLEKYVMTKLFTRVFASLPDDVHQDEALSNKMALIRHFIRPENLDIKPTFQNETSWLLAQKELQKINMYKAPRDKLVCILNCCRVISNLLLNASVASNESTPGADEFLPVLIYVTIKANPPQLHSNLLYIQRYRSQSRLVSEAAYYFTNMQSVESFISNIDAKSLSMDEAEYEKNIESARALLSGLSGDSNIQSSNQIPRPGSRDSSRSQQTSNALKDSPHRPRSSDSKSRAADATSLAKDHSLSFAKVPSLSDLENKGARLLSKEERVAQVFQEYPYLYADSGDLTVGDVDDLLNSYKRLVFKYVSLSKGLESVSPGLKQSISQTQIHEENEKTIKQEETTIDPTNESPVDTDNATIDSNSALLFEVESLEAKLLQDEAVGIKNELAS